MPKKKHRGAAAVRDAALERLSLPVFIKRELARLKKAGLWDGDPDDPNLDPAVVLTQLMVDDRLAPELRAVCAKTLLPYFHDDRSLILKAEHGEQTEQVMVVVRQFSQADCEAPKSLTGETPLRDDDPGTPDPATPARIDARNAPGAAIYSMPDDSPSSRPVHTADATKGFFEIRKDDDGVERLVRVDGPPRAYDGTPPAAEVITEEK